MNANLFCQQSERAFVGCVVQSEGAVLDTYRATPEHFFDSSARTVFSAAEALYMAGIPVSPFTVCQRLSPEETRALGGDMAVSDLCSFASPSLAAHLFDVINGKLTLRRAANAVKWAAAELGSTDDPKGFCAALSGKIASLDAEASSENVFQSCLDSIIEKVGRMESGVAEYGYKTSIDAWNRAFGGIMKGQLYALAGRPGNGKTAMMEMLVQGMLECGEAVTVFEKDMSPEKLMARIACRGARVPFWRYARGMVDTEALKRIRHAVTILRKLPLFLYNPSNLTAEKMCAISRRDIRTHGVKAVFLDHVQALRVGSDLRQGLTQASLQIRANVTETNVPHIVLAHINRTGAKGRPTPEDIKEFDQLLGDSDAVVMLWSEKQRADLAEGERMLVNFYVAKNRDGDVTEDEVEFDGPSMTFHPKRNG